MKNMQKECDNLENLKKNVAHFEEGRDSSTPEGREREMENSHDRIKQLDRNREWGDQRVDYRSGKSQYALDTRIDQSAGKFQKTECSEEIDELGRDGDQYSEGLGNVLPGNEIWVAPFRKRLSGGGGEEDRPEKKRRATSNPLEVELALSGMFTRENATRPILENENESPIVSVNEFKHLDDLKCTSNY